MNINRIKNLAYDTISRQGNVETLPANDLRNRNVDLRQTKFNVYSDAVTESMQVAIDETNRRRNIQMEYNREHGIEPRTVRKSKEAILEQTKVADSKKAGKKYYVEQEHPTLAADPLMEYLDKDQLKHLIDQTRKKMENAAKDLDFMEAARLRDELFELEKKYSKN